MKKSISLLLSLLFVICVFAQNNKTNTQKVFRQHSKSIKTDDSFKAKSKSPNKQPTKSVIFSEGFEGTTFPPTGWTKSNTDPTAAYQWVQSTESHTGSYCAAVHWDENLAQQDETLISPSINLTGLNIPILSFWWSMSYYWGVTDNDYKFKVKLSADGGINWTLVWTDDSAGVFADYAYYKKLINLTAYDTCTNFKVAFEYVGVNGDNLFLDDITVEELPDNRLELLTVFPGVVTGGAPFLYSGYSQIPLGQTFPVTMSAYAENTGKFAQTNIALHLKELNSGQTGISSIAPSLSSMMIDTLEVDTFYTISNAGISKIAMYASSDSLSFIPNADTFNIVVNSDTNHGLYSRDNNDFEGDYMWNDVTSGSVNTFKIANLYEITANTYAKSISVVFAAGTTINAPVTALIYRGWDNTTKTLVAQSDYHLIQPNEIVSTTGVNPTAVEIYFNSACPLLQKDSAYFVAIQAYGGTDTVYLAANSDIPQPDYAIYIYDTDNTWYYYSQGTNPPMIRLNTSVVNPTGIIEQQKNSAALYQNVPNPANNSTRISYELAKSEKVTLDIFDLTGRKVLSFDEGNKSVGIHSIDINLNSLSSGFYFYTLSTSDFTKTLKMIVRK